MSSNESGSNPAREAFPRSVLGVGLVLIAVLVGVGAALTVDRARPRASAAAPRPEGAPAALATPGAARNGPHGSVPRLRETRSVETRPGQPGYDPIKLGLIIPQHQIFAQEERSLPWAERMEHSLRSQISAELPAIVPGLKLDAVACRTTICQISWEKSPQVDDKKVFTLLRVLYAGSGGGNGENPNEIYLAYAGGILKDVDTDDAAKVLEKLRAVRKQRLESIKRQQARGHSRFPAVAASEWPAE